MTNMEIYWCGYVVLFFLYMAYGKNRCKHILVSDVIASTFIAFFSWIGVLTLALLYIGNSGIFKIKLWGGK